MKKIIIFGLLLIVALFLASCGNAAFMHPADCTVDCVNENPIFNEVNTEMNTLSVGLYAAEEGDAANYYHCGRALYYAWGDNDEETGKQVTAWEYMQEACSGGPGWWPAVKMASFNDEGVPHQEENDGEIHFSAQDNGRTFVGKYQHKVITNCDYEFLSYSQHGKEHKSNVICEGNQIEANDNCVGSAAAGISDDDCSTTTPLPEFQNVYNALS